MMSECLEWQSWPLKDRPLAGVAAAAAVVLVSAGAALLGEHVVFGLLALVILMGSLNPFFSPTRYRIDGEKVVASRWPVQKIRTWAEIRSCFVDRHGATLSPFVGKSFLEPYRGVRLLFRGNRDEVIACLRAHAREDVRFVDLAERARRKEGESRGAPKGRGADG